MSYKQFKANPEINPLCRLCNENNETFWHFVTECPRLRAIRDEVFLDNLPDTDNWSAQQLLKFSTYPTIYNMMAYDQDYVTQPIYQIDTMYSTDSDQDPLDNINCYL